MSRLSLALSILPVALGACTTTAWRASFAVPTRAYEVDRDAPFLKCHTVVGGVYVLTRWFVDAERRVVTGEGIRYDAARGVVGQGRFAIPFREVALLETNRPEEVEQPNLIVLGVATGASLLMTAFCIAEPKACFGSCPTFYAQDGTLVAEGFSASVARVLEATDVDALWPVRPSGRTLELVMANEALETHAVRSVRLLAATAPAGSRVLRAGDRFRAVDHLAAPTACRSEDGDCRAALAEVDDLEHASAADARDLADHETMELTFAAPRGRGRAGLVIGARTSLLETFVFYQLLAWMGRSAGDWMALVEAEGSSRISGLISIGELLGGIDVQVLTRDRGWVSAGRFEEVGPIAREHQLVVLPQDLPDSEIAVRLSFARGNWKIDRVALAVVGSEVPVVPVEPTAVLQGGAPDRRALAALLDPGAHLMTYPGEEYLLRFELPEGVTDVLLESRGYYYEWIRAEWLEEEDPIALARALLDPARALRELAPRYKEIEAHVDRIFWQSRIGRRRP